MQEIFWAVAIVVADFMLMTSVFKAEWAAPGFVLFAIAFLRQYVP